MHGTHSRLVVLVERERKTDGVGGGIETGGVTGCIMRVYTLHS